jgi:hypothetical protein
VALSERYADGLIRRVELMQARDAARLSASDLAQWAAMAAARSKVAAHWVALLAQNVPLVTGPVTSFAPMRRNCSKQCRLLRHLFGNDGRRLPPVPHVPSLIMALAQAVYDGEECGFALADALEEVGEIGLAHHFREEPYHPKGCARLDALLGKS